MTTQLKSGTGLTQTLDDWARHANAAVAIGRTDRGEWLVMMNFGQEAPDSPMAADHLRRRHLLAVFAQLADEDRLRDRVGREEVVELVATRAGREIREVRLQRLGEAK